MQPAPTPPTDPPDDSDPASASDAARAPLGLPASLDLTRADALHQALLARLAAAQPLLIDASAVERVSTACLQLLVAAAASAGARGLAFRLAGGDGALAAAAHDLGLGHALGLPTPAEAAG